VISERSDVTNAKTHGKFNETSSQIEAIEREYQARLKVVEAKAELGRAQEVGRTQPFVGPGDIDVPDHSTEGTSSGRATRHSDQYDYEGTLQALEDRFGDQHFVTAYHSKLATRTQGGRRIPVRLCHGNRRACSSCLPHPTRRARLEGSR
jgi:hypothetical protein